MNTIQQIQIENMSSFICIFKSIKKGFLWSTNPEIMGMLGFGPSHNKTEILSVQNEAE